MVCSIAQSPEAARKWRDGAKIVLAGARLGLGDISKLARKVKQEANLPQRMINMDFSRPEFLYFAQNQTFELVVAAFTLITDFRSSRVPESRYSDSDPHNVVAALPFLLVICMKANLYKSATKEATQRIAVDLLLQIVFERKSFFSIEKEAVIKVRKSTESDLDVAIADAVVLAKAYNRDADATITSSEYSPGYSWRGGPSAPQDDTVLAFVSENKNQTEKGVEAQLCFDFGTAHCHRRAIGMKPRIIYGTASFQGSLVVYASDWMSHDQEKIRVVKIATYDLTQPSDVLDAYIMLQLIHDEAQQAFEEYASEKLELRASDRDWFAPPRPKATPGKKRSKKGSAAPPLPVLPGEDEDPDSGHNADQDPTFLPEHDGQPNEARQGKDGDPQGPSGQGGTPRAAQRQDESMQDGSIDSDTGSTVDDVSADSASGSTSSESSSTQLDYQQDPSTVRAAMLTELPDADQIDDFDVYEHIRDEGGHPELSWYAFCKTPPPAPEADLLPHEVQICAATPKDPVSKALLDEHLQNWGYRGSAVAQWTESVVHSPPPPALDLDADAEMVV